MRFEYFMCRYVIVYMCPLYESGREISSYRDFPRVVSLLVIIIIINQKLSGPYILILLYDYLNGPGPLLPQGQRRVVGRRNIRWRARAARQPAESKM